MLIQLLLCLDIFIKHTLPLNQIYPLFTTSYLNVSFYKTYNTKFACSLGPSSKPYWQLGIFQLFCLSIFLPYYYEPCLFYLILAGFSNIADRFYNKAITDYILFSFNNNTINVNLADIIINYIVIYIHLQYLLNLYFL